MSFVAEHAGKIKILIFYIILFNSIGLRASMQEGKAELLAYTNVPIVMHINVLVQQAYTTNKQWFYVILCYFSNKIHFSMMSTFDNLSPSWSA